MSKREEGLRFGQNVSKTFDEMSADMGNQYSADVDSDSENDDVDENIHNFSSGLEASQPNDIAYGCCQQYGIAKPMESKIKVNTTKEKKVVKKKEKRDYESALMTGPNISGIQNYNTFLRSNSDKSGQLENNHVSVAIIDENNVRVNECTISHHFLALCGFFLIVVLIFHWD